MSLAALASPALAAGEPKAIEIGQGVEGRVGKGEADCYQIDAPKGATLSVSVNPKGFAPNVQVLRGARCDADVPTFETDGTEAAGADLPFKSVGGRYLVVVRAKSGAGAYAMKITAAEIAKAAAPAAGAPAGEAGASGDLAAMITAGLSKEDADKLIGGVAPEEPKVDPKVALMRKQLAGYKEEQEKERLRREEEARRAAEEAERRRIEEEERREMQREQERQDEANRQQMWGTILQGVQMVANTYVEAKQERFEAQQRLNQLARERDAANAARAAEQQRQAREVQQRQVDQQRAVAAQQVANAYQQRAAMIARATDPNVKRQLEAQQQQMLTAARAQGIQVPAGGTSGGGSGPLTVTGPDQQQQARQRAEAEAAAKQKAQADAAEAARKQQEATAKANAERERLAAEQRKQEEAMKKQQEEARKKAEQQMLLSRRASGGMSTVGLGAIEKGATPPGSGTLSMGVSNVGQCKATNVSVRYNLGVIMGEATVAGTWSFEGEEGCTPPHNTVVWLRLSTGSGYGFVRLDPSVPTANRGPGYNATGSPSWSQLVCAFNGSGPAGCMNEAQARAIWANGQVTGFVMGW